MIPVKFLEPITLLVWGSICNDKDELESSMFNYLNLQKEKQVNDINNSTYKFQNETLKIKVKDYYFSNVIARSSKTMVECNNSKLNLKSTGTEG